MSLGLVFIIMLAGAVMAVLWPLSRRRLAAEGSELAVYRDQLDEVERDRARGMIGDTEAEAASVELSRRLLTAADRAKSVTSDGGKGRRRVVAVIALVVLPLVSAVAYMELGRPDLPDQPLSARLSAPAERQDIAVLIGRVEAELQKRPEDGQGWEAIAPVYLRTGRSQDAVKAYSSAIRLLGPNAEREAGLGEALTMSAEGMVTPEAKAAFQRAVALDEGMPLARFYLGRAADQSGDRAGAATIYRELVAEAPPNAPWIEVARQALAETALGEEGRAPAVDPQALAAATPENRLATIRSMVEGLEARLKDAPGISAASFGWCAPGRCSVRPTGPRRRRPMPAPR